MQVSENGDIGTAGTDIGAGQYDDGTEDIKANRYARQWTW